MPREYLHQLINRERPLGSKKNLHKGNPTSGDHLCHHNRDLDIALKNLCADVRLIIRDAAVVFCVVCLLVYF
jgi:hypothetical protein